MSGLLAGKIAIITGAASGIGRAAVSIFTSEGARVVAGDRAAGVHEVGKPGEVVPVIADVSRREGAAALVQQHRDAARAEVRHGETAVRRRPR